MYGYDQELNLIKQSKSFKRNELLGLKTFLRAHKHEPGKIIYLKISLTTLLITIYVTMNS